jgi:hypothetical protein
MKHALRLCLTHSETVCVRRKSYQNATLPTLNSTCIVLELTPGLRIGKPPKLLHSPNNYLLVSPEGKTSLKPKLQLNTILNQFHPNTRSTIDHNAILPSMCSLRTFVK